MSAVILYLSILQTVRKYTTLLSSLNINKASSPVGIPNKIFILLKQDISKELADLFNIFFL